MPEVIVVAAALGAVRGTVEMLWELNRSPGISLRPLSHRNDRWVVLEVKRQAP